MAVESEDRSLRAPVVVRYLGHAVTVLAVLLGLTLLFVGTIAIIAELKGTWHWSIHLESTISYSGIFVSWLLALLVPLFLAHRLGRWVVDRE